MAKTLDLDTLRQITNELEHIDYINRVIFGISPKYAIPLTVVSAKLGKVHNDLIRREGMK